ncbi:hypothetical protein [Microbacterium panaciterrae]|uniref:Tyr recombinase domain-containing protein n=1 Tax=Microbacterium panaciterrae TaxID=985759 RepID=A0ABP8P6X5_9MICO
MTNPTNPEPTLAATPSTGYSNQQEENRRVIAAYRYRNAGEHWDAIADFVRATVVQLAYLPTRVVRSYLTSLSKLALWAYLHGMPLQDPADILTPSVLFRFDKEELSKHTPAARRNERTRLRNLIGRIGDDDPTYPRKPPQRDIRPSLWYYSPDEQVAFVSSTNTRNTERQRNNMRVFLGLGFGAGLTAKEINDARVGDITQIAGHTVVRVHGKHPRTVPVRADWAGLLIRGLGNRDPDDVAIDGYRESRKADSLAYYLHRDAPNEPHPHASGMRATWIIEHLMRGLRPDVLAGLAGVSVDGLVAYMPRMPDYDLDDYLDQIVGGDA